jgi:hypothetical protein
VKKSGASENTQILERNGNALGNGNGIGGDALGVASGIRFFRVKSAAECFDSVVLSLSEMLESVSQFSGFLFQFIHDDVPLKASLYGRPRSAWPVTQPSGY